MLRPGKRHGFTLIELLVVIGIIAILMGILVVNLIESWKRTREAEAKAEIAGLCMALERYCSNYGVYPPDETDFSSRVLVKTLAGGMNQKRYYPFKKERVKNGAYYSPLGKPYFYQENHSESTKTNDMHNYDSFDIWTEDRKGVADGLNNWGFAESNTPVPPKEEEEEAKEFEQPPPP